MLVHTKKQPIRTEINKKSAQKQKGRFFLCIDFLGYNACNYVRYAGDLAICPIFEPSKAVIKKYKMRQIVKEKQHKVLFPFLLGHQVLALLLFLMWLTMFLAHFSHLKVHLWGLMPWDLGGLRGVLFSPFIHGDFLHLLSNTFPLVLFGYVLVLAHRKVALRIFIWSFLAPPVLVWFIGQAHSMHIGASGVVYAFAAYLFLGGLFRKDMLSLMLTLIFLLMYLPMLKGVFPSAGAHISWESHLAGALVGGFLAFYYRHVPLTVESQSIESKKRPSKQPEAQGFVPLENAFFKYEYIEKGKKTK